MTIPQHSINIFQRPKEGARFQKRVIVLNYQHAIAAQGWYDTMSCDVAVRSQTEGQDFLNNYLGCLVKAYADDPYVPMWEGLISRMTFNTGGASYTISLDELANRVSVVYTGGSNVAATTTVANNTTSQAMYGIKEEQIDFGVDPSAGTHRTKLRDTILGQRAFPQTSITMGQGQANLVHIECIGIFHTIEWEKPFSVTASTTTAFGTRIGVLVGALANGTTFFNNADTSQIAANAATTPNQARGQSYWELILKVAEGGDGSNYWVTGVTPTDPNTGTRVAYYRQANAATEYTARQADGLRVRDLYGRIVPPWTVRPDRTIMVTDVLVGYNTAVQVDPRLVYIFNLQYDANRQSVQWFGADDTTAKAAWMLKRGFKPIGRAFGASLRVIST